MFRAFFRRVLGSEGKAMNICKFPVTNPTLHFNVPKISFTQKFSSKLRRNNSNFVSSRCESRKNKLQSKSVSIPSPMDILEKVSRWADEIKERGMKRAKPLYTRQDWVRHRSSSRHIRHVMSSFSSRVIVSLIPPVSIFTTFAVIIASYNTICTELSLGFPLLHGSSLPCELTAPALALLLVFRTEASYSRFEQGRRIWTQLLSHSLNFARQCLSWLPSNSDLRQRIMRYILAFPVALKCHVMPGSDMRRDLGALLQENELVLVLNSKHPPNCLIQLMSHSVEQMKLEDSKQATLDSHISLFNESTNACERILGIPIPLSYTRLTSRFLVLWHLSLPIVLWDECKWLAVPATFVSSASLFCIEEVGVLIEEPFPMLPLENLCMVFVEEIKEMVKINSLIKDGLHTEVNNISYKK